ncbi:uncharacterized protein IL334_007891 [Kwoniella shivajii]|uniref:Carbohydrate kinase PfkB domain-containing protein n=1 Tax=Kwoniella shivajii TaxID=564305 RepID=A0ABZ1DBB6_9TREE|nr:hypothetical protein IL334_007891 [Kwoniella shivajii]
MDQVDGEPSSHQPVVHYTKPILASIGTVLIDAFDSPPRPIIDPVVVSSKILGLPTSAAITTPTLPTPPSPSNPSGTTTSTSSSSSSVALSNNIHHQPLSVPPHLITPITSPVPSVGPSTPQLSLDDIPSPNAEDVYEMLGGGALYALVGARFWLSPKQLRTLVDRSPEDEPNDLPIEVEDKLKSLGEDIWVWNRGKGTKMTRARIRYEGDIRFFQPIVKAPHRTIAQINSSPLHGAEYLHISPPYSPENVATLLDEIDSLKKLDPERSWSPKIVFEPTPPSCHPGQKEWLERILSRIQVLSPNHEEIFSFYSIPLMEFSDPDLKPTVEKLIKHLVSDVGIGEDGKGIVIVRCGRLGACVGTKLHGLKWCPAYFTGQEESKVRDVTGAGNAFLGGYIAGLSLSDGDPYEALLYATVSASFVVEQFGLPILSQVGDDKEEWNGDSPYRRLESLGKRVE